MGLPCNPWLRAVRTISLIVVAALLARIAWLSDDSLITLRTILNICHGWGFGFNALEDVQGYTHPLWMLLWLSVGSLTGSWTISILFVSLSFTIAAIFLILRLTSNLLLTTTAVVLVLGSNAITEYSTSGLENPLAFFLTIGLFVLLREPLKRDWTPFAIGLMASLTLLTRLDLALLIAPAVAFSILNARQSRVRPLTIAALGFVPPLLVWFSFSVLTYGSAFPNTLSAKRNIDIPLGDLIGQGLFYLRFSVGHDPFTGLILLAAILVAVRSADRSIKAWALGMVMYVLYAVQNGGDFMASRFLSVPTVVGTAIVVSCLDSTLPKLVLKTRHQVVLFPILLMVMTLVSLETPTVLRQELTRERWSYDDPAARGIADERAVYAARGMSAWDFNSDPNLFEDGKTIGEFEKEADSWPINGDGRVEPSSTLVVCGGLGSKGINSGPMTHLIDPCGLTDRFLAETKFDPDGQPWRIGHFDRPLPAGYEDAIKHSDPSRLVDPSEEERLRKLWEVIRD